MKHDQRIKILKYLSRQADKKSIAAITNEVDKASKCLSLDTQYDRLIESLESLNVVAFRIHEKSLVILRNFLRRLDTITLTYHEYPDSFSIEFYTKYKTIESLIIKALEIVSRIRYHDIPEVLSIYFEYSTRTEEKISKCAIKGIEDLAEYDLEVFYSGDGKRIIGWAPQETIIGKVKELSQTKRTIYFDAIISICERLLSPSIKGHQWTSESVTWKTKPIPPTDGIKKIRQNTLDILTEMYELAQTVNKKRSVIATLNSATRLPHLSNYSDELLEIITENTIDVLKAFKAIALNTAEELLVRQKIEHDTYWLFYHKHNLNSDISNLAFEIRDGLYQDEEYQVFRVLIGFESIFHDWAEDKEKIRDLESANAYRERRVLELADEVSEKNFDDWSVRIVKYAKIQSNDLATFPMFGKFLEGFAEKSPSLALRLLRKHANELEGFFVSLLLGLDKSEQVKPIIYDWFIEDKYLFAICRFFEFSSYLDVDFLSSVKDKALAKNDINTLIQILSTIATKFEVNRNLIKVFYVPILKHLTTIKNSDWVNVFWSKKKRRSILQNMDDQDIDLILSNLLHIESIEYHIEDILRVIAETHHNSVINFFCKRISIEEKLDSGQGYEAVPFEFQLLSETLSNYPEEVLIHVKNTYSSNKNLFEFRGARLLKNIFIEFQDSFANALIEMIDEQDEESILIILSILKNYDGNQKIYSVCREIVKRLPQKHKLLNEVSIAIENTGVVSGEYGVVHAYQNKINLIKDWLHDDDKKVRVYAESFLEQLEDRVNSERKRTDETIKLRKYKFGEDF